MMVSGVGVEGSLVKKSRPSLEGWVSAERMEEMWWRTGVVDSGLWADEVGWVVARVWAA